MSDMAIRLLSSYAPCRRRLGGPDGERYFAREEVQQVSSWEEDLRQAEADFANIVIPALRRTLPHGDYLSVQTEGLTSPSAGLLDRHAGIDWLVDHDSGVTSIASRVQWMGTPRASFTIGRAEMKKRFRFADPDEASDLGPAWTVQAYLRKRGAGPFLSAVSARTVDLFTFIREHPACVKPMSTRRTGKPFSVVWIDCLWDENVLAQHVVSEDCRAFYSRDGVVLTKDIERVMCPECGAEGILGRS
jgi:hypothetical protein